MVATPARAAASPRRGARLIDMNSRIYVRDVLTDGTRADAGRAPPRRPAGDHRGRPLPCREHRGRGFVELPGIDHVPWIDGEQVLEPIEAFLAEIHEHARRPIDDSERALANDPVHRHRRFDGPDASIGDTRWTALLDRHDQIMREVIEAWEGRFVKSTGDGVLAVFETPTRALRAARVGARSPRAARHHDPRRRAHERDRDKGRRRRRARRVDRGALLALAEPDEVLVTTTVRDSRELGHRLRHRGPQVLKGVPGTWVVHAVAQRPRLRSTPDRGDRVAAAPARQHSTAHRPVPRS